MIKDLFGISNCECDLFGISNCECEWDKGCDVGEYLDHKNCKCRKKLVDKIVDECAETVEEVKLAKITLAKNNKKRKCSPCTLYNVLFSILFTINFGTGVYFNYFYWYLKKIFHMLSFVLTLKQQFSKFINGRNQTINIKNRTYCFYNDMINLKKFVKN